MRTNESKALPSSTRSWPSSSTYSARVLLSWSSRSPGTTGTSSFPLSCPPSICSRSPKTPTPKTKPPKARHPHRHCVGRSSLRRPSQRQRFFQPDPRRQRLAIAHSLVSTVCSMARRLERHRCRRAGRPWSNLDGALLYRDAESEYKVKLADGKQHAFIECYASFRDYKIVKADLAAKLAGGKKTT